MGWKEARGWAVSGVWEGEGGEGILRRVFGAAERVGAGAAWVRVLAGGWEGAEAKAGGDAVVSDLTEAQEEALDRAREVLKEHFDAAVVSVCAENEDGVDSRESRWHGGGATAVGLAELLKRDLMEEDDE